MMSLDEMDEEVMSWATGTRRTSWMEVVVGG
jgi:hypothetical protein